MVAPEALLLEMSGNDERIGRLIGSAGPLLAPYDMLVHEDGWLVDPSRDEPTAPFDDHTLVPAQRTVNALLVACDYAVRRGAQFPVDITRVLTRESPLAIVTNADLLPVLRDVSESLGVAVGPDGQPPASFRRRARAHAELNVMCDPVLSFQPSTLDWDMGDNSLSSFIVHNVGERDGVSITGEVSERWGVEVGIPKSTSIEALAEIESEVAIMPSFLPGVTSRFDGESLEVGWAAGEAPLVEHIGECIRVWTKALFDLEFTDVRIVFAPPRGRAPLLTEMRARAREFREYRDAVIAGQLDSDSVVTPEANRTAGT